MLDLHTNYPFLRDDDHTLRELWLAAIRSTSAGRNLEIAARWLSPERALDSDCIRLCAGGNHASLVVLWALALSGSAVAVEPLTYPGFIAQAQKLGIKLVEVAADRHGMLPDALVAQRHHVGAVYLTPTVHNPLGTVMPTQRRLDLIDVARAGGFPIVQDDAYHFLEAKPPPHFCALAPDCSFTIISFTKPINPNIKVAYLSFPAQYRRAVEEAIRLTSSGTSQVLGEVATRAVESGYFAALSEKKRAIAEKRQAVARTQLEGLRVSAHPTSYHMWIELGLGQDAVRVVEDLKRIGIATTAGNDFSPTGRPVRALRVALSNAHDERDLSRAAHAIATTVGG